MARQISPHEQPVRVPTSAATLDGDLTIPPGATGIVVFAHGSGSSRHSIRNRQVARHLNDGGLATLLIDLLTGEEEAVDMHTAELRFNIDMLAERLAGATDWVSRNGATRALVPGYFGASTGAAAALVAAAEHPGSVHAVVSRGGRPDLAGEALRLVRAPTLLIVGSADRPVLQMNQAALKELRCEKEFAIVPGATHLFEEPGALDMVAELARAWFDRHLVATREDIEARRSGKRRPTNGASDLRR